MARVQDAGLGAVGLMVSFAGGVSRLVVPIAGGVPGLLVPVTGGVAGPVVAIASVADGSRWRQWGGRPAAHPVLRGAADGAAPAAVRVCRPGGVHPRGVGDRGVVPGHTVPPILGTGLPRLEAWGRELGGSCGSCEHRAVV